MPRAFSVLWTMQERQAWLRAGQSRFTVAYGNSYRSRGVEPGDALYIVKEGLVKLASHSGLGFDHGMMKLFFAGRLKVVGNTMLAMNLPKIFALV